MVNYVHYSLPYRGGLDEVKQGNDKRLSRRPGGGRSGGRRGLRPRADYPRLCPLLWRFGPGAVAGYPGWPAKPGERQAARRAGGAARGGMVGADWECAAGGVIGQSEGRDLTTNEELRELMDRHKLRIKDVAEMLEVSAGTVKSWRSAPDRDRHRNMPRTALKLLQMQLEK